MIDPVSFTASKTPGAGRRNQRYDLCVQHLATDEQRSGAAPLALAFAKVAESNPIAADLLRVCAFLNAVAIPEDIFQAGAEDGEETFAVVTNDPLKLLTAIGVASRHSLL